MAGTPLSGFTQFMSITGPATLTGVKEVVNDAQLTNYNILGYMLRGQQMSRVLRGGSIIQDRIFLSAVDQTESYLPFEPAAAQMAQTGKMYQGSWRFFRTKIAWADEPMVLNAGADMNADAQEEAYKSEWFELWQNAYTSAMNYWERVLMALPNTALMEPAGGQEMYSIPFFLNDHPNGLWNPGTNGVGGVATTKEGISPIAADSLNWKPTLITYGSTLTDGFTPDDLKNVITALDKAYVRTSFKPPPMHKQYFEDEMLAMAEPGAFVICSEDGIIMLKNLFRASNDRWGDVVDPGMNPLYKGAPFVYVPAMDTGLYYAISTTSTGTERTADLKGPRYIGIQPKYMHTVFHKDRYMLPIGPLTDWDHPTEHRMFLNTFGNLIARSLIRHFVISPAASQTMP